MLNPLLFLNDWLDEVCCHCGPCHMACPALATSTVTCQALGMCLWPWMIPDFCPECVGIGKDRCCPVTCTRDSCCCCCESHVCHASFVLSGACCVPAAIYACFGAGHTRRVQVCLYNLVDICPREHIKSLVFAILLSRSPLFEFGQVNSPGLWGGGCTLGGGLLAYPGGDPTLWVVVEPQGAPPRYQGASWRPA